MVHFVEVRHFAQQFHRTCTPPLNSVARLEVTQCQESHTRRQYSVLLCLLLKESTQQYFCLMEINSYFNTLIFGNLVKSITFLDSSDCQKILNVCEANLPHYALIFNSTFFKYEKGLLLQYPFLQFYFSLPSEISLVTYIFWNYHNLSYYFGLPLICKSGINLF